MSNQVCTEEFAAEISYAFGLIKGKVLPINSIVLGQLYMLSNRHGEELVLKAWETWLKARDLSNITYPVTVFVREIPAAIAIVENGGAR